MKSKLNLSVFVLLLSCYMLSAQQQEVKKFSLQEAVEYAKRNNKTLANAKIDQEIAAKKVKEVKSSGLPQINASGNLTDNLELPTQVVDASKFSFGGSGTTPPPAEGTVFIPLKFGMQYAATVGITASQLLFDGTYFLGLKAAREYVNLAKAGTKVAETEIAAAVTKMYYAALLTQANIKMMDNTLDMLTKTLSETRAYYKSGLAEKIDMDRLELGYSNTQIQRDKIQDQYILAILSIKLQLGIPVSDSVVLTDDLEKLYASNLMVPVETKPVGKLRPDYQLIEQQMLLQTYDVKRYKYGRGPTISLAFVHQYNSFAPKFGDIGSVLPSGPKDPNNPGGGKMIEQAWFPMSLLQLNMNLPVFDGFRKANQIQQSKLTLKKLENEKKYLENNIENEVIQSRLKYTRAKQQMDIQKRNMELAEQIYKRANIKYKEGVGSSLELTVAENDLKNAQSSYLTSVYEMLVANVDYKKAMGY